MSWYRTKVGRDVARWQSAGWISETGAAAIRADLAAHSSAVGAPGILAILGAVLFGFAVMSFVAANWSAMSKLARFALLLAVLLACYGAAAWLFARQLAAFAHAAVLGGIAVYGASIMLIAQMYHMDGNAPDAVLMWALGALLAAALVRSSAALATTFLLLAVWTGWERTLSEAPHWTFLAPWAAATATAAWLRWHPGLHLAALSLVSWVVPLGYLLLDRHAHWLNATIGVGFALGAVATQSAASAAPAIDRYSHVWRAMFAYGVVVAFIGLFAMQFFEWIDYRPPGLYQLSNLIFHAAITIVLLLGAVYWALAKDNRLALWFGYIAFAVEVFTLYVRTLGTLLNTSLFFLIAALIVSVLAWAAWRLHQRQVPAREVTP